MESLFLVLFWIRNDYNRMNNIRKIIVTGSNRGIGLGLIKNLASKPDWHIIMAVRNIEAGQKARKEIIEQYPNSSISIQTLDISNSQSIQDFSSQLQNKYDSIDILFNNAAVKSEKFDSQTVNWIFKTNFYGTIELTATILPFLKEKGKIITLTTTATGPMVYKKITNDDIKKAISKPDLTQYELFDIMRRYEQDIADNTYEAKGWPTFIYGMSKLGISAYGGVLGRAAEVVARGIQVYSCCPGYVKTDMTHYKGNISIEDGIITPTFLIEKPFQFVKQDQGQLFYTKRKVKIFP